MNTRVSNGMPHVLIILTKRTWRHAIVDVMTPPQLACYTRPFVSADSAQTLHVHIV